MGPRGRRGRGIGPRLAKVAVAARWVIRWSTWPRRFERATTSPSSLPPSPEGLDVIRHSAAHVLAEAATRLFPGTKVAIGPAIKDGFYYDFEFPQPVGEDDLPRLSEEIQRLLGLGSPFGRREVTKEEAAELFKDEPYKLELVRDLPADATISIYGQGEFVDLCRGPHVPDSSRIGAVALLSVAGALLAREERQHHAHSHIRDGLPDQEGSGRIPRARGDGAAA